MSPWSSTSSDSDGLVTWRRRWLGLVALLYCAPVVGALRPITDPDIWWHLRTGEWVVRHRAVPWSDPFSTYRGDTWWIAYSWLAEIALYGLHRIFGLVGVVAYSTILAVALTAVLHALMLRYFTVPRATALTALLVGGMATGFAPRTYLLSMLLLTIEAYVLLHVRESGQVGALLLLPALFAVWANVHIQFVYGLLLLAIAVLESIVVRLHRSEAIDTSQRIAVRPIIGVAMLCWLATFLNPYHVHLYRAFLEIARQRGIWTWIIELRAMDFRQPADWVVLGWSLAAAFVLGRRGRVPILPAVFFVVALFVSFRARRDVWLVVLASGMVVTLASPRIGSPTGWLTWRRGLATAGIVLPVAAVLAFARGVTPQGLESHVAEAFPARAAAVIESRGYAGRLFNPYDWGGYLLWRLPTSRVSIDPRSADARLARSLRSWLGERGWASNPELLDADVVVGPTDIALTSLLRLDPRFTLVYEDDVATVFVPRVARAATR